jgi:hypothetical protein
MPRALAVKEYSIYDEMNYFYRQSMEDGKLLFLKNYLN